ncbi:MAG TPA: hypothetical protein VIX73_09315 [Kofleriaceae bacterium]
MASTPAQNTHGAQRARDARPTRAPRVVWITGLLAELGTTKKL